MIKVELWQLVRDWVHARYKYVKVKKFSERAAIAVYSADTFRRLGKITAKLPREEAIEIGFVAPKGMVVWPPLDPKHPEKHSLSYYVIKVTDPQMFEKMDKILRKYEPKRSK